MTLISVLIITVIVTAVAFDFVNGWNDSANAIATVVATRVMSPTVAVLMAAVLNLAGAMIGVEVADTMSKFIRFGPKYRPGLVAEYHAGDQSVTRVDPEIAFSWNDSSPDAELPGGPFEVKWSGFLWVRDAAKLRLHASVQGDVVIELKGERVLEGSSEEPQWLDSEELDLKAGEIPLEVTFRKTLPTAQLKLAWSSDTLAREPIPDELLLRDKPLDALVVSEKKQEQFDYVTKEAALVVVVAALISGAIWAGLMTVFGMPISGSHSLIGGVVGAGVAAAGTKVLVGAVIKKTLLAMLFAPLMGFIVAYFFYVALIWLTVKWRPTTMNQSFGKLQIVSASWMAFTHGTNDAQKVMGIITMALIAGGFQHSNPKSAPKNLGSGSAVTRSVSEGEGFARADSSSLPREAPAIADAAEDRVAPGLPGKFAAPVRDGNFYVQFWVQILCAAAIGVGTAVGGWGVIKTLGHHLTKLGPPEGFAAETSAAIVLTMTAWLGVPTSTTHTITGSILGLGATRGMSSVRWGLGEKIILAWVFTLPSTIMMGGGMYWLLAKLLRV